MVFGVFPGRTRKGNMRIQKIIKHGNALAVVIPVQQLRELCWKRGDYVEMVIDTFSARLKRDRNLVIRTWQTSQKKSL